MPATLRLHRSTAADADPLALWDSVPLFMRSLPDLENADDTENTTLSALQALLYDAPPSGMLHRLLPVNGKKNLMPKCQFAEVAAGFKAQANELFAARKYRDALGFYSRALDECGKDLPIDEKRILWSNRSAANLELGKLFPCPFPGTTTIEQKAEIVTTS